MPGWVVLPLRAFLGVTFTFAGLQKLASHDFFDASKPSSIQAQIHAAERTSPIHGLLSATSHFAVAIGILIALGELAVGVGTLVGLWGRIAAAGGMLISLMLFLTVSFHTNPYYTGSDIVFLFAWTPLLIAGSGGVLSLDAALAARERHEVGLAPAAIVPIDFATVRQVCGSYEAGRCRARQGATCEAAPCPVLANHPRPTQAIGEELDRRTFLAKAASGGALAGLALVAAGVTAAAGRLAGRSSSTSSTVPSLRPSSSGTTTTSPSSGGSSGSAGTPSGSAIGAASDVPVGGAAAFQSPSNGDPAYVVQPESGKFAAFDAVCPHAGCTVQPDVASKTFNCPCHGSQFRLYTGAVLTGPATTNLSSIKVTEGADGQLYA